MDQQSQPSGDTSQAVSSSINRESASDRPTESNTERRLYGFGGTRRGQLKTTDLLPKRRSSFAIVVALLVAAGAGLNLLAHYSTGWQGSIGAEGWELLQLNGPGTLAGWFCSVVLLLSGFAAWQIFSIQKHRRDDYHGRYRFWAWAGAVLVLASVNCVADIGVLLTNVVGNSGYVQSESTVWVLLSAKLLVLSLIFVRGLYSVRGSWGAISTALIAWASFSLAAGMQIPDVAQTIPFDYQVSYGNLIIIGCVAILVSQLTFGRFVFLQAEGLISRVEIRHQRSAEVVQVDKTEPVEPRSELKSKKVEKTRTLDAAAQLKALVAESETSRKSESKTHEVNVRSEESGSNSNENSSVQSAKSSRKKKKGTKRSAAEQDVAATLQMTGRNDDDFEDADSEASATIKMSKAERRRQRKAARNQRRAA